MAPLTRQRPGICLFETDGPLPERPERAPFLPSEIIPPEPPAQPEEPSDLDDFEAAGVDDRHWDVFLPDDDLHEPLPDRCDFWNDDANDEFSKDD